MTLRIPSEVLDLLDLTAQHVVSVVSLSLVQFHVAQVFAEFAR